MTQLPDERGSQPTAGAESEAAREAGLHERARREKLRKIQELGVDPWGSRFDGRMLLQDVRALEGTIETKQEGEGEAAAHVEHGPTVRAAGRVRLQRKQGKTVFMNIEDWSGKIQILLAQRQVTELSWLLAECVDLGDTIGIDGELKHTKTGELTIFARELHFLGKCLEPPPDKHAGLTDIEQRQRMRYLDLAYTEGVRERFLKRSKIVSSVRNTLTRRGFVEVEGPTLHTIAGGAAARPFLTHHNALDMKLFLRIALELHLKRLLVGGVERVFELGRVYRNEGISPKHNPEFTMLEVYEAFGDYGTMMGLTEAIIVDAIDATGQGRVLTWNGRVVDFTPPFQRKTYDELFGEHAGVDPADADAIAALARSLGLETAGRHPDVIKSDVFEAKVEDALAGPIFVLDYPASICPLTKRKASNPAVAERFELFVHGMEVANAYTELNDPDLQESLFSQQLAGQKEEDSMAKMDHDFVKALKQGMPPAGGLGIGIDRLTMLLTGSISIRDVILFPLFRGH